MHHFLQLFGRGNSSIATAEFNRVSDGLVYNRAIPILLEPRQFQNRVNYDSVAVFLLHSGAPVRSHCLRASVGRNQPEVLSNSSVKDRRDMKIPYRPWTLLLGITLSKGVLWS